MFLLGGALGPGGQERLGQVALALATVALFVWWAAAGGGHFSLLIVSNAFRGVSRLERHQIVLARVSDLLPHPIHALSIKALAPEEFS